MTTRLRRRRRPAAVFTVAVLFAAVLAVAATAGPAAADSSASQGAVVTILGGSYTITAPSGSQTGTVTLTCTTTGTCSVVEPPGCSTSAVTGSCAPPSWAQPSTAFQALQVSCGSSTVGFAPAAIAQLDAQCNPPGNTPPTCILEATGDGGGASDSLGGFAVISCPVPGAPPAQETSWAYGFVGDTFTACVTSWSVTYDGITETQGGGADGCAGPFDQYFPDVACTAATLSVSFTVGYASNMAGWDPTVQAVGAGLGLISGTVTQTGAVPTLADANPGSGEISAGGATFSMGSETIPSLCPTADWNQPPPASVPMTVQAPASSLDSGAPTSVLYVPSPSGGHLDWPTTWDNFDAYTLGPGTDTKIVSDGTTYERLDATPYAGVVTQATAGDGYGQLQVSFNAPSPQGAPYTLTATGTFSLSWGSMGVTWDIAPNLTAGQTIPVTLSGMHPRTCYAPVYNAKGVQTGTEAYSCPYPATVTASFETLAETGNLSSLASETTSDQTRTVTYTDTDTVQIPVYGPAIHN